MHIVWITALSAFSLFFGVVIFLEIGRRAGVRHMALNPDGAFGGLGAIEGAVFGLLGLLIAFTFSGALQRFDVRRDLIVEEANDIGTAYLRLDLLPAEAQPALRESFRRYLASRLLAYRLLPDIQACRLELERSAQWQQTIWTQAVQAVKTAETPSATMLLLPALNSMFDIVTTRTMAGQMHPPAIVFVMLYLLALAGALLAGYDMAISPSRNWLHSLGYALAIAASFYIILDLEFPRIGLLRVDDFDRALEAVLESMK
jgi:hypothetical protein